MGNLRLLREALRARPGAAALDFFGRPEHHTDLQQLLNQHFALPIPLELSLKPRLRSGGWPPGTQTSEDERMQSCCSRTPLMPLQIAPDSRYSMQTHLLWLSRACGRPGTRVTE